MAVIDVHTHMLTREYLAFLDEHGGPKYECKPTKAGQESIWMLGAPFMTLMPETWDYEARIRDMDKAGVDLAVVSLTCPNAYFGDEAISIRAAKVARWPKASISRPHSMGPVNPETETPSANIENTAGRRSGSARSRSVNLGNRDLWSDDSRNSRDNLIL